MSLATYPSKPLTDSVQIIDIPYVLAGVPNRAEAVQLVEDLVELSLNTVMEVLAAQMLRGKVITEVACDLKIAMLMLKDIPGMFHELSGTFDMIMSVLVTDASGDGFGDAFDQMKTSKHLAIHRVFYAHSDFSDKLLTHIAAIDDVMKRSAESTATTRHVIVSASNMLTELAQVLSICS
jgi:hypothetical protein